MKNQTLNDYVTRRAAHMDALADRLNHSHKFGATYQKLLCHYYRFFIPKGARVLEVGCGLGDLLNALEPSDGVGLDVSSMVLAHAEKRYPHLRFIQGDAHTAEFDEPFDFIILSDLVNDLWDVQQVLTQLKKCCGTRTRIIINFQNNLWSGLLTFCRKIGFIHPQLEQNWLTPEDIKSLLCLSGFEVVHHRPAILLPIHIPMVSFICNRILAHLPVFKALDLTHFFVARVPYDHTADAPSVSVIIPARNEAGHIKELLERTPQMGRSTEIIFVEGSSSDDTYSVIQQQIAHFPDLDVQLLQQTGKGKGDAVRLGFDAASGDVLMILDADCTVAPEDLIRFYNALISGKGEFINGVRLVYPLGDRSMRFFNMGANKFFGMLFSWLLGQTLRDTLCGTKVLWKKDYLQIAKNRAYFGELDPFGDFDLLFGAAKMNLKILDLPIRYGARIYGETNIHRWSHGMVLLKFALKKAMTKLKLI